MKIKFKLGAMMIGILVVVITGIAVLLLNRAAGISRDLSLRGVRYLTSQQAENWQAYTGSYLRIVRTLANIMADYEDIPVETRRNRFDAMLMGTMRSEPDMVTLYTIWKPNSIDSMDQQYIGRPGSTATGQYAVIAAGIANDAMINLALQSSDEPMVSDREVYHILQAYLPQETPRIQIHLLGLYRTTYSTGQLPQLYNLQTYGSYGIFRAARAHGGGVRVFSNYYTGNTGRFRRA